MKTNTIVQHHAVLAAELHRGGYSHIGFEKARDMSSKYVHLARISSGDMAALWFSCAAMCEKHANMCD